VAELFLYEVPHRGHTATVKLSEDEAKSVYGDDAKKLGAAKQGEVQPVTQPPYAVDVDSGDHLVTSEKKAPPARNKARTTK